MANSVNANNSANMSHEPLDGLIVCPNCGADRIAKSHFKNMDRLVMRFLPKSPYRCLHCYHRFWVPEPFFASSRRVISWLGVIACVFGLVFLPNWNTSKVKQPKPFSDFGSSPNAVPGQPPNDLVAPGAVSQPAYINNTAIKPATSITPSDSTLDNASDRLVIDQPLTIEPSPDAKAIIEQAPVNNVADPAIVLEELNTTEQLQERLSHAKASAKQAEQANIQNQARLQQSVAAEQNELQSLLKVDINFRIDQWRKAWEMGFVDDYLNFYSLAFTPVSELSREQWIAQRKQRIRPGKNIDLVMDNFDVVFSVDNSVGTVSFDQVYKSGLYVESSRKQLVLRKEQQEWKIVSETEISDEALK